MENKKIESELFPQTSIFSKEKDKKRKGDFYKANETQVSEILKRKVVKRESEPAPNMLKEEYQPEITMEITDTTTLERFTAFSAIQRLIQWTFFPESTNPLWISIGDKTHIENYILIIVNGFDAAEAEMHINKESTPFLEKLMTPAHKTYLKPSYYFNPSNENFWEMFFSTKKDDSAVNIKKKITPVVNTNLDYEKRLIAKYESNILSLDELQANLYPIPDLPIYSDYLDLSTIPAPEKFTIKDKILGLDCEMVKKVRTQKGLELARLTIINFDYQVVYDCLVKPEFPILDYLTKYSGLTKEMMDTATKTLKDVQTELSKILCSETILVGHSLENDLNALNILHLKVIDTSVLYFTSKGYKSSLKTLSYTYLNNEIQKGTHDSSEDAKAALSLAKLKIEIFDYINPSKGESKAASLDVLEKLLQCKKPVLPLDETKYLKNVMKYGIHFDEIINSTSDNVLSKMLKWVKMKNSGTKIPCLIAGVIRENAEILKKEGEENEVAKYFEKLDKKIEDVIKASPKNSSRNQSIILKKVFTVIFCNNSGNNSTSNGTLSAGNSSSSEIKPEEQPTQQTPNAKRNFSLGLFFSH